MESINCKEVSNSVGIRYGYGDGVGVNVVIYVVSVVFLSFAEERVRKKTDFCIEVLEVTERGTEDFGSEECVAAGKSLRNYGVSNGLAFRHSPNFYSLVDNVGPSFSVLVNVEGDDTVGGLQDGETGSGVETVRSVGGSDPTGNVAALRVDFRTACSVNRYVLNHELELIHGPFLVSNEIVDIDAVDIVIVLVYGLVVNDCVSTVVGGKSEVTNNAVKGFFACAVLDGVGVYVLLVEPRLREVDGTRTDVEKVVCVTSTCNAGD
jgi:hypothetical protein